MSINPPLENEALFSNDEASNSASLGRPSTPTNTRSHPDLQRVTDDTPAKPHSTQSHSFLNGSLEERRDAVLKGLGYTVPEVDIDFFMKNFLPPLKAGIGIESVLLALREEHLISPRNKWAAFETPPKQCKNNDNSSMHEDKVFAPLGTIFERATYYAETTTAPQAQLRQTWVMRLVPNEIPDSERGSTTRPDAYLILKEADDAAMKGQNSASKTRWWYDIALTGEFKKSDSDAARDDDVGKVVFSMQHVMSLDPCRRFTFGMTIENTSMRLWFSCRTLVAVSEPFDFTQVPERLTHIFLSIAFASKEELGWDQTIQPFLRDGTRAYRIQVNELLYETLEVLSDFSADWLIGRATRVWKVKQLQNGKLYVLKDVWVEDDRELEHMIRELILDDIEAKYGKEARDKAALHLLTPAVHWLVTANGQEDHTTRVIMRGNGPSFDKKFRLVAKEIVTKIEQRSAGPSAASDKELLGQSNHRLNIQGPGEREKLHHRRHYRVVFEEVADPLFNIRNLSDVFLVLEQAAEVLILIHGVQWVHRDISTGNLYLFDNRGLIGDLEYAKRRNDDSKHEVRTGTLDFMAVEAALRGYIYELSDQEKQERLSNLIEQGKLVEATAEDSIGSDVPFFHNDLHDVESLWWASIWELFFNCDSSQTEMENEQIELRRRMTQNLFSRTLIVNDRLKFFQSHSNFMDSVRWFPESFQHFKTVLNNLRIELRNFYIAFEAAFPNINYAAMSGVQEIFRRRLSVCRVAARGIELVPYKVSGTRRVGMKERDDLLVTQHSDFESETTLSHNGLEGSTVSAPPLGDAPSQSTLKKRKLDDVYFLVPQPPMYGPAFGLGMRKFIDTE